MRFTNDDLSNATFRPNDNTQPQENIQPAILVFTSMGSEDLYIDLDGYPVQKDYGFPALTDKTTTSNDIIKAQDLPEACALKEITQSGTIRYFIKIGPNHRIYNPAGMYTEHIPSTKQALGLTAWKFNEVNQKVFELYLRFLQSHNQIWLNQAQREIA